MHYKTQPPPLRFGVYWKLIQIFESKIFCKFGLYIFLWDLIVSLQPQLPSSPPQLFPSQITDLVTFASLLTLPSPVLPFPLPPRVTLLCFCPNLWPLGFEERQRWPLKIATAKFVRGHSRECTSLSTSLSRLHILPPLHFSSSHCPPQTHTDTLMPSSGPLSHK